MRSRYLPRFVPLMLLLSLLAACSDSADDAADTTLPTATTRVSSTSALSSTTVAMTTTIAPTTTVAPTTTTTPGVTDFVTTLPPALSTTVPPVARPIGEPYDLWVPLPSEGAILGVVGVRHDDLLNVRSGPDVTFDVVERLEPTQTGIAGAGEGWQVPSGSVWWRIETGGVVGWASQQFLSRLGGVDDLTSFVVDRLGEVPVAKTMLDLGLIVANTFADEDTGSRIVVSVPPTVGDLGEVTYDVMGLADDSVGGYRLHIFGQPGDGGGGFSLMAVEATTMCQRGVSDGLCV